ncbi:DUF4097 family beta strand repeat-containing protein [Phytomonospora sp. NPDC050363]|uniref:DUF4097 family beta strand repeat-containing protein n=1 Tax=Phytomonospora sp. NPDC050363 TaxID=3155642 RepID=UPI0033DFCCE7
MPSFATPAPINVSIELGVGNVHITAGDRTETVVDVRPTDPNNESDRKAAERTVVDFSNGTLRIDSPRAKFFDPSRKTRSVEVTVEVPAGSRLRADSQAGGLRGTGVLGETRVKTGAGDVWLDRTGPLHVDTGAGRVTVAATGDVDVSTGSGRVNIDQVNGDAVVKSSNGDIELGSVTGETRTRTGNGSVFVERPGAGVEAKSSNGAIRVGAATSGLFNLKTGMGEIEIAVAEGVAALLDASTGFGRVNKHLDGLPGQPGPSAKTVDIRAHSGYGDITVNRA